MIFYNNYNIHTSPLKSWAVWQADLSLSWSNWTKYFKVNLKQLKIEGKKNYASSLSDKEIKELFLGF